MEKNSDNQIPQISDKNDLVNKDNKENLNNADVNKNSSDSVTNNYHEFNKKNITKKDKYSAIFELKEMEYIQEIDEYITFIDDENKKNTEGVAILTNYAFRFKDLDTINNYMKNYKEGIVSEDNNKFNNKDYDEYYRDDAGNNDNIKKDTNKNITNTTNNNDNKLKIEEDYISKDKANDITHKSYSYSTKDHSDISKITEIIQDSNSYKNSNSNHNNNNSNVNTYKDKINFFNTYLLIPYFLITKIDKQVEQQNNLYSISHSFSQKDINKELKKKQPNNYNIIITTKDNRLIKLKIESDKSTLYHSLLLRAFPKKSNNEFYIFAQEYAKAEKYKNIKIDGWNIYNINEEYKRQNLDRERFTISDLNMNFNLCQTYPERLVFPSNYPNEKIIEASNFRTKNRLPAVSYYNKEYKTALLRSSQTKSGLMFNRSESDEKYLECFRKEGEYLDIYDARSYINAFANKFKGAGFENTDYYKNTRIYFCDIENIHFVRNSYLKLQSLLKDDKLYENKKFLTGLDSTGWMNQVSIIIQKSLEIVNSLKKSSVLIHCSDGWDRTAQLSSLSQLLMDPYYRTIYGFCVLIEKEWVYFGHQFAYRSGFHVEELSENSYSPVFLQWLDSVYQVVKQYPQKFEFRLSLLEFIADNIYSAKYGTFLVNNEYTRLREGIKTKTISIWTDVLDEYLPKFQNPYFCTSNNIFVDYDKKIIDYDKKIINITENIDDDGKVVNKDEDDIKDVNEKINNLIDNYHRIKENKELDKEGIIKQSNSKNNTINQLPSFPLDNQQLDYYNLIKNDNEFLCPQYTLNSLTVWEDYYLKHNKIHLTDLGKFYSYNDKGEMLKYDNINNFEFYYNEKAKENKILKEQDEEISYLKQTLYGLLNKLPYFSNK